ncbi:MAG: D-TA family PLP-dependent enzyme [Verrucomicrobiae bacterium]|nr:D-TA family PLP-dependent enzyme [Verrucomicrobiae bacterium]
MKRIANLETVPSPALLFDADAIRRNLELMLRIVGGDTTKLRPHIKTHKCGEILELQHGLGVRQVKAATIAEAELSAQSGMNDVLISYPLVGPNVSRLFQLIDTYPETQFSCLVDCEEALGAFARTGHEPVHLFVDLDCGMHRTGISPGPKVVDLARAIVANPALRFAGLHAYDGHIHDAPIETRTSQFEEAMAIVDDTLAAIETQVGPVPLLVAGGSPTFALHAARALSETRPRQCSPGTTVLWDCGYGPNYSDLPFEPAALLLARVVSHPGEGRICVDLGHKAVAAENPINRRVEFPDIPEAEYLSQSEEHLVIGLKDPSAWPVGMELVGIPKHVCPTVALHQEARLIREGAISGEAWKIAARDRRITI